MLHCYVQEITNLFGAKLSNSSKKMTQGRASRAFWKTSRTFRSLSPTYILISSGPFTLIKFRLHSVAIAFANSVLPFIGFQFIGKYSENGGWWEEYLCQEDQTTKYLE